MFVDERAIIVQLRWVLWSQRARSRSTRYLFGVDLAIILKFIALRVEARGDGPFLAKQLPEVARILQKVSRQGISK